MDPRKIQYVGKKPSKPDNVAGTSLVWNGPGDVKVVDPTVAACLLQHPDIWKDVTDMQEIEAPMDPVVFHGGREEQIITAFGLMDETNAEHFDENGKPNIAVVEQLLQYEVTQDEMVLAWMKIEAARDESLGRPVNGDV